MEIRRYFDADMKLSQSYDFEFGTFLDPEHSQSCDMKYEAFPNMDLFGIWNIRVHENMKFTKSSRSIGEMILLNIFIMRCYGYQITEKQSTQLRSLQQFNHPENIIPMLLDNDSWLSHGLDKMKPLLESVMQALEESDLFCISLSGSKSEFHIKPSRDYFHDTDMRCLRKDYVAQFVGSCICSDDVDDNIKADHMLISVDYIKCMRSVKLDPECKNILQSIIKEAFCSSFSTCNTDTNFLIIQKHDDHFKFFESHKLAITLGCSRETISAYGYRDRKPWFKGWLHSDY